MTSELPTAHIPHLNWLSRINGIIPNVRNIYKYMALHANRELKGSKESHTDILPRYYIHRRTNQFGPTPR